MTNEKESKVQELIDEHVVKVGECLNCFKVCFEAFLQGDIAKAEATHKNCDYTETEADIIRREIGDCLYSGAFLPLARKGIYVLSESVDKIADKAETASDVLVNQNLEIPDDYKRPLREIVEATAKMFQKLQVAIKLFALNEALQTDDDLAAIREKLAAVGVMESEIDDKEEELMRAIFSSELPLANKIQLERYLHRVTKISDVIEDAADQVNVLVIHQKI